LADGVNPELKVLSLNFTNNGPVSAEEFRKAGQMYAAAVARLEAYYFRDPEVSSLAAQMKENLGAAARSCDRLALRLEQSEPVADAGARTELENQHQRHVSLVGSIERICRE